MKKLVEKYRTWSWETRLLAVLGAIAILPALASLWTPAGTPQSGPSPSVDTHIPRGYVLIPIEVQNFESLDAIFGRFGRVDLYRVDDNGASHRPVAVNVRLLRAPQNPSRFAVLVPESESRLILSHGGSYVVVVKPAATGGTEFVKSQTTPHRKILYGGG